MSASTVRDEGDGCEEPMHANSEPKLMHQSLPIAGMLHMLDHITKHFLEQLRLWKATRAGMQAILNLFHHRWRRERFVSKCLQGRGAYAEAVMFLFDVAAPTIAEW